MTWEGQFYFQLVAPHEKEREIRLEPHAPGDRQSGEFLSQKVFWRKHSEKLTFDSPYIFLASSISKYHVLLTKVS